MRYRQLGRTGMTVSELCLGTMTFARECDEALSVQLLERFIAAGGNFIDTADVYSEGRSEEIIGRGIAGPAARLRRRHQGAVPNGAVAERCWIVAPAHHGGLRSQLAASPNRLC